MRKISKSLISDYSVLPPHPLYDNMTDVATNDEDKNTNNISADIMTVSNHQNLLITLKELQLLGKVRLKM